MSIELSPELFAVFVTLRDETKEIRAEMTADLLTLEAQPDAPGVIERVGRNAHTLKGNASSLGLEDVEELMHSVESLILGVSWPGRNLEPAVIDVVLFAIDEVLRRTEDILANRPKSGGVAAAQARVQQMVAGVVERPQRSATLSSPAPAHAPAEELLKIGASQFTGFSQVVDELEAASTGISERAAECGASAHELEAFAERAQGSMTPELARELRAHVDRFLTLGRSLIADSETIVAVAGELRGALEMLQLVQASSMLDPLRRAVHDHGRRVGKEVLLEITGAQALVDRRILQELRGAIAHALRNAVDHGIEAADERAAAGKPARALLRLELRVGDASLELDVSDDGRGLEHEKIRSTAVARGLVSEQKSNAMPRDELLRLIWLPGFSTSCAVTATSGRGFGLDAIQDCVAKLSGSVDVSSVPSRGTTFHFRIPISMHLRSREGR